jgi:hypothetical protein
MGRALVATLLRSRQTCDMGTCDSFGLRSHVRRLMLCASQGFVQLRELARYSARGFMPSSRRRFALGVGPPLPSRLVLLGAG